MSHGPRLVRVTPPYRPLNMLRLQPPDPLRSRSSAAAPKLPTVGPPDPPLSYRSLARFLANLARAESFRNHPTRLGRDQKSTQVRRSGPIPSLVSPPPITRSRTLQIISPATVTRAYLLAAQHLRAPSPARRTARARANKPSSPLPAAILGHV